MDDRIQPSQDPPGSSQGPRREGPGAGRARRPRRSLARTLAPLGVAAWAVLELWLLISLGSWIGVLGVFAVLAAGVVVGAVVIKRAGRRAWRMLAESLQPGQEPGAEREGAGNGLTMLAGLLLMVPGLVTKAAGLVLLLPPVRALLRRRAERLVSRSGGLGDLGGAYTQARVRRPDGKVVQGEVIRDDEERPRE